MSKSKPPPDPFRWFDSSPEVIHLVVLMYVRFPLSLRNVEDLLFERGIDICYEGFDNLTGCGSETPPPLPQIRQLGSQPSTPRGPRPGTGGGLICRSGGFGLKQL